MDGQGSEQSSLIVYITGFGPFANVQVNPSADVAKSVHAEISKKMQSPQSRVIACHYSELEVSIAAVELYFDKLQKEIDVAFAQGPRTRVLLYHFGVKSREQEGVMRVEVRGYNELFSSAPDVRGVRFNHDPIDVKMDTTFFHESWLGVAGSENSAALERIVDTLNGLVELSSETNERQKPRWVVSRDAGRYLCNYTLFRALELQRAYENRVVGLFVHVTDPSKGKKSGVDGQHLLLNPSLEDQTKQAIVITDYILPLLH